MKKYPLPTVLWFGLPFTSGGLQNTEPILTGEAASKVLLPFFDKIIFSLRALCDFLATSAVNFFTAEVAKNTRSNREFDNRKILFCDRFENVIFEACSLCH